jgi:hypothetical protein
MFYTERKESKMTEKIDLKEIRRQVYLFYSEDGLAYLGVGLMIFGFGALLMADAPYLVGVLGVVAYMVWYLGKQTLVIPRVGSIQPGPEIKRRLFGFFLNLFLFGAGALAFYLVGGGENFVASISPLIIFGFVVGLGISSLGLALKASRFYFYGLLVFAATVAGELLSPSITAVDPFLVSVISAGVIITLSGLIVMGRFLSKYPLVTREG